MPLTKKCRHSRNRWRQCRCSWYSEHYDASGRRVWVNVGAAYQEARASHITLEAKALSTRTTGSPVSLSDMISQFLATYPRVSPATMKSLEGALTPIGRAFGHVQINRVDVGDVATWIAAHYAPSTAHKNWSVFCRVLKMAHKDKAIKKLPDLTPPKWGTQRKAAPLTPEELDRVIRWMEPKYSRLGELQLLTGLRIGECLALTRADIELGKLHIRHSRGQLGIGPPKTENSERTVLLGPRSYELLQVQATGPGYLWPMSMAAAHQYLRKSLKQLGLYEPGRGWHMFRHANTVLRERSGQPLRHAADQLGHGRNYAVTLGYGWAEPTNDEAAAIESFVVS